MTKAIVPTWIETQESPLLAALLAFFAGIGLLTLLAQVAIPLPWTPVPITGQTFGVALIALHWGARRGLAVMAGYLSLAFFGMPVLASGASGLLLGPTFGYLVGMVFAVLVVGKIVESGFASSFFKSLLTLYAGSVFIFGFGLLGLSFFVPSDQLLVAGLWPFLFGDFVKNVLAVTTNSKLKK